MPKRPIDRLREGASQMDIQNPDDGTPLEGFLTIRDQLHAYTKKAVYRVQLADSIDPDRTNINVPNTYQCVLSAGSDSTSFCKTILTAKALFDKNLIRAHLDVDALMGIAFDASIELVALDGILDELRRKIADANDRLKNARLRHRALAVPNTDGLETIWKNSIQRVDHFLMATLKLARQFYPSVNPKRYYEGVSAYARETDGAAPLSELIDGHIEQLKSLREWRNCTEHPKENFRAIVEDFKLLADNSVHSPSIIIQHEVYAIDRIDISQFVELIRNWIAEWFEFFAATLCLCNMQEISGFATTVAILDESKRREKHVRFGHVILIGDEWQRLG